MSTVFLGIIIFVILQFTGSMLPSMAFTVLHFLAIALIVVGVFQMVMT
jgi:hypothetical protein